MSAAQQTGILPGTSATTGSFISSSAVNNSTSFTGTSPRLTLPDTNTLFALPRQVAKLVGLENMATRILGRATDVGMENNVAAAGQTAGEGVAETAAEEAGLRIADIFNAMRRFSGFFAYMTSRWSLACFSVVRTTLPPLVLY